MQSDMDEFDEAFDALLDDSWGDPAGAAAADLEKVWRTAAEQGWCGLGRAGAAGALLRAARSLGRRACPLPLADTYVAATVLAGKPRLVAAIEAGGIRPVVVGDEAGFHTVEAARAATHVLRLGEAAAVLARVVSREERPGVAVPAWSRVTCDEGDPVVRVPLTAQARERAHSLLRLFLAARALAAAEHTHELALEHARTRHQFGRPIGSFGAVQQRTASAHIDVTAGAHLVAEAVRRLEDDEPWELSAELAVAHAQETVAGVQLAAHHTFGAVGFFEEHPAPWLFRRAHADLARIGSFPGAPVSDRLLAGQPLPPLDRDPEVTAFRAELRALFAELDAAGHAVQPFVDDPRVVRALADRGCYGLTWPPEQGGKGAGAATQAALMEEVGYGRIASYVALNAVMFLGNAILEHGTPEQQARHLPVIREGRLKFCLGYSEPETGSDLASLRTRAVRDGGEWVINGQKTWTTRANASEWIWLATRTHPDASLRHKGLTVFLLPLDTPGITLQEHRSLAGEVSCSVFLDDVRVPDSARVGGVDDGWRVITTALAGERVSMGAVTGSLHRQLDDLLAVLRAEPALAGAPGSAHRARLTALAARLQGARLLVRAAVEAAAAGSGSRLEAPMAGVLGGELAEELGETALRILGPQAALAPGTDGAHAGGAFSHGLLISLKYVIGGGTNDVLRGVIARTLGLPR
ncbi:acyl-CoA dehydrogenase family protein [Streptomyces mutabilis]|uniref:acyl-CoA dehydrogenase family protein n=1 Tax=Streptomyces mutabilis TaxID=67332 RepID=UPI0033B9C243